MQVGIILNGEQLNQHAYTILEFLQGHFESAVFEEGKKWQKKKQ